MKMLLVLALAGVAAADPYNYFYNTPFVNYHQPSFGYGHHQYAVPHYQYINKREAEAEPQYFYTGGVYGSPVYSSPVYHPTVHSSVPVVSYQKPIPTVVKPVSTVVKPAVVSSYVAGSSPFVNAFTHGQVYAAGVAPKSKAVSAGGVEHVVYKREAEAEAEPGFVYASGVSPVVGSVPVVHSPVVSSYVKPVVTAVDPKVVPVVSGYSGVYSVPHHVQPVQHYVQPVHYVYKSNDRCYNYMNEEVACH